MVALVVSFQTYYHHHHRMSIQLRCSVQVSDPAQGYGTALIEPRNFRVSLDAIGTLYTYLAVPNIESLSFNSSGTLGGGLLTITGSGFSPDPSSNSVDAAGSDCKVVNASLSSLTCVLGPGTPYAPSLSAPFIPGGIGLLRQVMHSHGDYDWNDAPFPGLPWYVDQETQLAAGFAETQGLPMPYNQQLTGFFVPPVTASYQFFMRAGPLGECRTDCLPRLPPRLCMKVQICWRVFVGCKIAGLSLCCVDARLCLFVFAWVVEVVGLPFPCDGVLWVFFSFSGQVHPYGSCFHTSHSACCRLYLAIE